jgi:hypothetical protein
MFNSFVRDVKTKIQTTTVTAQVRYHARWSLIGHNRPAFNRSSDPDMLLFPPPVSIFHAGWVREQKGRAGFTSNNQCNVRRSAYRYRGQVAAALAHCCTSTTTLKNGKASRRLIIKTCDQAANR